MKKYAYVMILYGDSIYFTGALVTGWSLKKVTDLNVYDIVILCTPDVPKKHKSILEKIYTRVMNIEYATVKSTSDKSRFVDVFTKLKCLLIDEYEKIVLMDIDMCVVKSLDKIFNLNPPAGSLTNGKNNPEIKQGEKIPKERIFNNNILIESVNAGLLLLKPDKREYKNIIKDLEENPEKLAYTMPEQEYLTRRWINKWSSISFYYNYQFGLTGRIKKNKLDNLNEIKCYHYSSKIKPWFILSEGYEFVKIFITSEKRWDWLPYEIWFKEYNEIIRDIKKKYGININSLMKENINVLHLALKNLHIKQINNYFIAIKKHKILKNYQ